MSSSVSYELLSFKGGSWIIESVFDNKDVAVQEAARLLEGRHQKGVRVIEEKYNAETDHTTSRIVFSRQKGEKKTRPKPGKEESKTAPAAKVVAGRKGERKHEDTTFLRHLLTLVLSVGGVLFGVIALLYIYLNAFGDG